MKTVNDQVLTAKTKCYKTSVKPKSMLPSDPFTTILLFLRPGVFTVLH